MSSSARGQDEKAAALCPRSQVCHCPKIRSHRVRGQRLIRGVLPPSRGTVATDDPVGTEESVCLRHKSSRAPRSCFAARADLDALTLACLRIRGHGRNIWGFAAPACSPSGCFGSEAAGAIGPLSARARRLKVAQAAICLRAGRTPGRGVLLVSPFFQLRLSRLLSDNQSCKASADWTFWSKASFSAAGSPSQRASGSSGRRPAARSLRRACLATARR
jgi:hypothetical protein